METSLNILQTFYENFQDELKTGSFSESNLAKLEENKINILTNFINNMSESSLNFVRQYVTKLFNDCLLISNGKNIKDSDHNYILLRIKDFLCDFFFVIFSEKSECKNCVTVQDIFILLHLFTVVAKSWMSVPEFGKKEELIKKVHSILNFVKLKMSEVYVYLNQVDDYYEYFFDYLYFYLRELVLPRLSGDAKSSGKDEEELLSYLKSILRVLKNVQFKSGHENTKKVFYIIIDILSNNIKDPEKQYEILTCINELKFKTSLGVKILSQVQSSYINILIDKRQYEKAALIIKLSLRNIERDSKEELRYYKLNFYTHIKIAESSEMFNGLRVRGNNTNNNISNNNINNNNNNGNVEGSNACGDGQNNKNNNNNNSTPLGTTAASSNISSTANLQGTKANTAATTTINTTLNSTINNSSNINNISNNALNASNANNTSSSSLSDFLLLVLRHPKFEFSDFCDVLGEVYRVKRREELVNCICDCICEADNSSNDNNNNNNIKRRRPQPSSYTNNTANITDNGNFGFSGLSFSSQEMSTFPNFSIIFLVLYIHECIGKKKVKCNNNEDNEENNNNCGSVILNNRTSEYLKDEKFENFFKLVIMSFLENTVNDKYKEYSNNIGNILHNILFLLINSSSSSLHSFANFYILQIIEKFPPYSALWKEFALLSINFYIEERDIKRLNAVLRSLENAEEKEKYANCEGCIGDDDEECLDRNKRNKNEKAIIVYAKIISLLGEDLRFDTINRLTDLCDRLGRAKESDYEYYIKIFRFVFSSNIEDINIYLVLLKAYSDAIFSLYDNTNSAAIFTNSYKKECKYTLLECVVEVLFTISQIKNFEGYIMNFSEVLDRIALFLCDKKLDKNTDYMILPNISIVIELIKMLISFKNSKSFVNCVSSFPEFVVVDIAMLLCFLFRNYDLYLKMEFSVPSRGLSMEHLKEQLLLFTFFVKSKIFLILFELEEGRDGALKLKKKYEEYEIIYKRAKNGLLGKIKEIEGIEIKKKNKAIIINQPNNQFNQIIQYPIYTKVSNILEDLEKSVQTHNKLLYLKIIIHIYPQEEMEKFIVSLVNENFKDKEFIFSICSLFFNEGKSEYIRFLLEVLFRVLLGNDMNEITVKEYNYMEVFNLFIEHYNSLEIIDYKIQIKALKTYVNFLLRHYKKVEDALILENIEWIYYMIYKILDKKEMLKNKEDFLEIRNIYERLNILKFDRQKSNAIRALSDLIIKYVYE